jgi:hypothetical protein
MDQAQKAGVITTAVLLAVAIGAVLYACAFSSGRRQWQALNWKGRILLVISLIGWVSWVASAKALRPWSAALGLDGHWLLDVLPSFIAGITVSAYAAFLLSLAHRDSAPAVFLSGAAITLLLEFVQLWLPNRVFDPLDVVAGVCGAALIAVLLVILAPRVSAKADV